jgi:hypothetical protein
MGSSTGVEFQRSLYPLKRFSEGSKHGVDDSHMTLGARTDIQPVKCRDTSWPKHPGLVRQ